MQKTAEKDIFKILALVLAVLIVAVMVGGILLTVFSGNDNSETNQSSVETTELQAKLPSGAETKVSDKITISSSGVTKSEATEEEEITADYIIPESNSKILSSSDISGLSAQELNYAKNEIYARHGRKFASQELQSYFESKSWYEGLYEPSVFDSNYSASLLSDTEKKNAEFLKNAVEAAGGYTLDQ